MGAESEVPVTTLCVADRPDPEVLGVALEDLERDGQLAVRTTAAADTLERLDGAEVDCVLLTPAAPPAETLSLVREIRDRHPALPIVMLAGRDGVLKSRAVAAGVTRFLRSSPDEAPDEALDRLRGALVTAAPSNSRSATDDSARTAPPADSTELMRRALDEAPVGITIADIRRPDAPLIYVNEGFERETGYDAAEVLGRNCRFLQGEATDSEAVARMAAAIENREPVSVELRNYRKDGELFWNRVDLAPLRDRSGEITHYVGFQTDVTERKEAEAEAKRRAAEIREERRTLEHLLDRIDGLLQDVTRAVVERTDADTIQQAVCERISATEGYLFAWIGAPDLGSEEVTVAQWAGADVDPATLDDLAVDLDEDPDLPVARAVESRSVVTTTDPGSFVDPTGGRSGGLAAVPLLYGDTAYGVLVVYTARPDALDHHEVAVLEALGRVIGTALHATESRRVLADDNVVELEFAFRDPESFFVALSRRAEARLEYAGAVARDDDSVLMFFTVDPPSADIEAAAADLASVHDVTLITEHEGAALYEFALSGDPIVETLAEYGAETRMITAEAGEGRLQVEVPNETNARSIADLLQERYERTELVGYNERERPPTTKQEFIASVEDRLTERQLTALRKAYVSGFFEWKRQISGEELATSMDISRATFHQHLRAAERKLVEEFFAR